MARVIIADAFDLKQTVSQLILSLDSDHKLQRGTRVFLKPNLTYPVHLPGVTTTPAFMTAVIECLSDYGVQISIGESDGGYGAWSADVSFRGHGMPEICRRFGAQLINLTTAEAEAVEFETANGPRRVMMPRILLHETDTLITLPVPKIHSITLYSGAVKNSWGLIPDSMRLKLHPVFDSLIWSINRRLKTEFVLADAQYILDQSGPIFGTPVFMNRVIASDNIYAFDVAVARHLMKLDITAADYLQLGKSYGFSSEFVIEDTSTGPTYQFGLKQTLRAKAVRAAFPRQWAVNLIWDSPLGKLAHTAMYKLMGNPVETDRQRIMNAIAPRATASDPLTGPSK